MQSSIKPIVFVIKRIKLYFFIVILFIFLQCCNALRCDPADSRKVDPNVDVRARQAIEEGRGLSLAETMRGAGRGGIFQFASSNPMWRATLEILDFLPLANVDYSGGIITVSYTHLTLPTNREV